MVQDGMMTVETPTPTEEIPSSSGSSLLTRRWRTFSNTLRFKTIVIITATIIGLLVLIYVPLRFILVESFLSLEQQFILRNVERAKSALNDEIETLSRTVGDYASWDDTYTFVAEPTDDYITTNLADFAFVNSRLNLLLITDSTGRVVFSKAFDLENAQEILVPGQFSDRELHNNLLLLPADANGTTTGFVLLTEAPMLIAARPILTTDNQGPARGTMLMGRYLNAREIESLATITQVGVAFSRLDTGELPLDVRRAQEALATGQLSFAQPVSQEHVAGYAVLNDAYNNPALILRVETTRGIYQQGMRSLTYFTLSLLLASLILGLMMLVLLEKVVLSRLTRLSASVTSIGARSDLSARVSISGKDELAELANAINGTMDALEHVQAERKRLAEQMLNKKLESVAVMASGIGHDFGNIVTAIGGNVALAKMMTPPEHDTYQLLSAAEKATGRAKALSQQLLTFGKGNALVKKATHIGDLLTELTALLMRGSNTTCALSLDDNVWNVEIDEGQIGQVLTNLIVNAQQAMLNGGTISISATNTSLAASPNTNLAHIMPGQYVRITIKDQGTGIPREHLEKIFDPYFTTKATGNGLGLAMCYSIIKKHDGLITVESEPGVGTTFYILLPAAPNAVPFAPPADLAAQSV